jgi:hypothetical protein
MDQHVETRGAVGAHHVNPWTTALQAPWAMGLAVLLAVQIVAAVALSVAGRGPLEPAGLDAPLLAFEPAEITSLVIEAPGGTEQGGESLESLSLNRSGDGWVIAGLGDFPADGGRVDQLLTRLAEIKRPLPVATSPEARTRHKVADDRFERRLTLKAGEQPVATLTLGDSPGFRRTFARPAEDDAVYDLDLPLFEVSERQDDWLVRDQLGVDRETIERVSAADWTLVKGEDGWRLEGSEQRPDQTAVDDLLARISSLAYRGVLGTEDRPEYGQSEPSLVLTLGLSDGSARTYRVSRMDGGEDRVLKSDGGPWLYRVSAFDLEGIEDLDRAKLLGEAPAEDETPAEPQNIQDGSAGDSTETPVGQDADTSEPAVELESTDPVAPAEAHTAPEASTPSDAGTSDADQPTADSPGQ